MVLERAFPAPHDLVPHMEQSMFVAHNQTNGTTTSTTVMTPANVTSLPIGNTTSVPVIRPPCQWILYQEIHNSRVRIWDLIILIPNVLFLMFLLLRLRTAIAKLKRTSSPIFFAFYGMVLLVAVISVLRCTVSMTVNAAVRAGDIADKVLWLVLRFFLLATELSVVIFGLAFGHLDSKTSIRRVLLVTSFTALAYSCTQGVLEFKYPDQRFHVKHEEREYDIFAHGGMLFWFASSIFFFVIYSGICCLPCTSLRQRFALPTKRSFYWYCGLLACLNLTQAVGSGMLYYRQVHGMCPADIWIIDNFTSYNTRCVYEILREDGYAGNQQQQDFAQGEKTCSASSVVDVTAYLYFTCFAPLVYGTFLRDFFATALPPNILFSYKAQVDDAVEEDTVSLPHQIYGPNQSKDMADYPPQAGSYDSTHFDSHSPNPLYSSDMPPPINAQLTFSNDFFGNGVITMDDDLHGGPAARYRSVNS